MFSLKYNSIRETQLIYSFIIIRLATCFDPAGSSSGLHYKPVALENCINSWETKQCLQKINMKGFMSIGHELFVFIFCKHCLGSQEYTQLFNISWFIMKAWWWPRRVETCCQSN